MSHYVGLDVSLKETSVCVLDAEGAVVWRGQCRSDPAALAATVRKRAPEARRVVLESGTLSTWHWHGLKELGVPVVCVDARQAKAALSGRVNKSDALDAEGLAQLARTGWYAKVRVKSLDSHRVRSVLVGRAKLVALSRVTRANAPCTWAKALAKKVGLGKARVALARKLAVILFAMWRWNRSFRWTASPVGEQPAALAMAA